MMEFNVLKNKKIKDGKMDLLSNFLQIDYDNIIIEDWILIDIHTSMSLDLISYVKYGSNDYVDVLIKFNRLSNPLEVDEGDVIAVPNLQSFQQHSKYTEFKSTNFNKSKSFEKIKRNVMNGAVKSSNISNYIKKSGNVII